MPNYLEKCLLSDNIMDYHVVAQGKTTIPGVDDAEELTLCDVRSLSHSYSSSDPKYFDHVAP